MKWMVRLDGPTVGLNELSQFLKNPSDVRIFKEGDFYYVESDQLDNIETYDEAGEKAKLILAEIKGIAQLLLLWNIPITIGAMRRPNTEGIMQDIVRTELTFHVRPMIPRTISHCQDEIVLDPVKFFPHYLHLAMNDELVQYILLMVDFGFKSWWALFCILDAIEGDIGIKEVINPKTGKIRRKTKKIVWMDQNERKRFRATPNDRRLVGIYARHGQTDGKAPFGNPMTLLEAQKFIWGTVIKWLNDKEKSK